MFPEKHFEDIESSQKRRKVLQHAGVATLFLSSFLILGPLIHELSHVVPLEVIGCPYGADLNFQVIGGIYAEIQPLCHPSTSFLSLFYLAGYTSTFTVGWGMIALANRSKDNHGQYIAASGTGVLLSILLSIGNEGDIQKFVEVAGLNQKLGSAIPLIITLSVFLVSFLGIKVLLED